MPGPSAPNIPPEGSETPEPIPRHRAHDRMLNYATVFGKKFPKEITPGELTPELMKFLREVTDRMDEVNSEAATALYFEGVELNELKLAVSKGMETNDEEKVLLVKFYNQLKLHIANNPD